MDTNINIWLNILPQCYRWAGRGPCPQSQRGRVVSGCLFPSQVPRAHWETGRCKSLADSPGGLEQDVQGSALPIPIGWLISSADPPPLTHSQSPGSLVKSWGGGRSPYTQRKCVPRCLDSPGTRARTDRSCVHRILVFPLRLQPQFEGL